MTQPVTTAAIPYALKQGVKAVPAKQHPAHKTAVAAAAKTQTAARKG